MTTTTSYTQESCSFILEQVVELFQAMRMSNPQKVRLNNLLTEHFGSRDFRSLCCYGHTGEEVTLDEFNILCILPSTNWNVRLGSDPNSDVLKASTVGSSKAEKDRLDLSSLAGKNIALLVKNILKTHPDSEFIQSNFSRGTSTPIPTPWTLALLGLRRAPTTHIMFPDLPELRRRITICLNGAIPLKRANAKFRFFSQEAGFLWQQLDDSFDVNRVYLEVCSKFPNHLESVLALENKTLDQLAGVEVATRYPQVESQIREALSRGQKEGFESKDLKLADGSLGGTVFAIHNDHYSVEWLAAYLVDSDNQLFLEDVRAGSLSEKERRLRIFSIIHTEDHPSWIQFGDKGSVYLYFSRLASSAEQSWLKICSYITNLLIDDINNRLKSVDTHGKYILKHVQYDTGVVALGNPSTSSLGAHQDGKPGIVCPHTSGFSSFNLMVPTMAFQNHCAPTATISWWRSDDPKKEKQATFTQDFFMNHFQLMGVNHSFHHKVSNRITQYFTYCHCLIRTD
jgi:hypothetical protein